MACGRGSRDCSPVGAQVCSLQREARQEKQAQRIKAAADVLKELNPDILLLQEVRDYDACNRLAEAIQPATRGRKE
jgi:hypothetical protein